MINKEESHTLVNKILKTKTIYKNICRENAKKFSITERQIDLLLLLLVSTDKTNTSKNLLANLDIDKSQFSRIISQLNTLNLLKKYKDNSDKSLKISITVHGAEIAKHISKQISSNFKLIWYNK